MWARYVCGIADACMHVGGLLSTFLHSLFLTAGVFDVLDGNGDGCGQWCGTHDLQTLVTDNDQEKEKPGIA
jgi:hypothetical protein